MHNDDKLIFEALRKWKLTSMAPAQATDKFGKAHVKVTAKGLRNGEDMVEVHVPVDDKGYDASEDAEDRSVQPGGAIEDITDIQRQSMDLLKQHGFHVNKVSNAHAEQQGGPMVYMGRKTGVMHQVAEVDPQGMINEETPEEYLANHVHAEDAEGVVKQPYNAMTHLTQAANHIRHILQTHADDEAQVEHIIRMAQIILGPKSDHAEAEYRKMLDGLIVILNRFIIVPMN
jgi:hypothetical protein